MCFIIIKAIIYSLIVITKKTYVIKKNWNKNNNLENINNNIFFQRNQNGMNFPIERIVYVRQDQNMINANKLDCVDKFFVWTIFMVCGGGQDETKNKI